MLVALSLVLCGVPAAAQSNQPQDPAGSQTSPAPQGSSGPRERKWEVEAHGGWSDASFQSSGSGTLPTTGLVVGGQINVSSFYFGDGARLFNQNLATASKSQPLHTVAPLDTILMSSVIDRRRRGGTLGVRLGRTLGRRLMIEMTADYSLSDLSFTSAALAGIEAARVSFAPAIGQALSVSSVPFTAASVATVNDRQRAEQLFVTGVLSLQLKKTGIVIPYVTAGGGAVFNRGTLPGATLVGSYQLGAPPQILGTDTVELTYTMNNPTLVAIGGGGFRYFITPRWGLRLDARAYLHKNTTINLVNATPTRVLASTGSGSFPLVNAGALQFSATAPMNGPPFSGFTTFTGSGLQTHVNIAAGIFWRF